MLGEAAAPETDIAWPKVGAPEFQQAEDSVNAVTARLLSSKGKVPVDHFHKRLGHIMWQRCGMARDKAGLEAALREIPALREEFWASATVPGTGDSLNQSLERAARIADFLELGELTCRDALAREESCGGHFREEHQYPDGECKRDDANFAHVAAWEFQGEGREPRRNVEPLHYEFVKMSVRNYK